MKKIAIDINDTLRDNLSQFKSCYQKVINPDFEIDIKDITDFDLSKVFPFENKESFNDFKYNTCAYELFARAETTTKMIQYRLTDWLQNTMRDFDDDDMPEIFLFSPFEIGLTIQATYSFLSKIGCRCREMVFPIDSHKIWDRCDIMITANPNLLSTVPEGKIAIKIETPYNKDIKTDYCFSSLEELIEDKDGIFNKLLIE